MTTTAEQDRIALAGLLRLVEPPAPPEITAMVRTHGAADTWRSLLGGRAPTAVMRRVQSRLASTTPDELRRAAAADLEGAARVGAALIGPDDPGWPQEAFAALEVVRPYERARFAAPPLALYHRGGRWRCPLGRTLSLVGSRAATPYGTRIAVEIAADIVTAGGTVVSGAAFGIDGAAHRGALNAARHAPPAGSPPTIAVLACGIDRAYPAAHAALLDSIAGAGAIVSEYPPGATPARYRFLVRNRLIAALATATIVVEAGRRSGSLNTASTAAHLGRQVFALPGPVTSALSLGCHDLIRQGRASLATGWADIARDIGPIVPDPDPHRPGSRPTDLLDETAAQVHEALPTYERTTVGAIARQAALPVPQVLSALGRLQLAGMAAGETGMWRRIDT